MTTALIVLLAIVLTGLVALPLAAPGQADPLPDDRDPDLLDLQEERDALLGAIRELDARDDLPAARRDELRARYEAKAARVLRSLDERSDELEGRATPTRSTRPLRANWGIVGLLVVSAGIAATLGGFVLPRIGQDALAITSSDQEFAAASELRDLRRAAERDPSGAAWTDVGDLYWSQQDAEGALEAYGTAVQEYDDAPARAYQRLGLLTLQSDLPQARVLLEQARLRAPNDPNMVGTLAELYLQTGDYAAALEAFEDLASLPQAAGDELVQRRIELLREVAPLATAAEEEPGAEAISALADALWSAEARELAVGEYFTVLTEYDAENPVALARVGETMFLEGRTEDAVLMLERARAAASARDVDMPESGLLFLGNAAFAAGDMSLAIEAWEDYLLVAESPGRIPQLIERAQAMQAGQPDPGLAPVGDDVQAISDGAALYQAACAGCHGVQGGGGNGPALAGNPASGRAANVEDLIRYGRGLMPGFQAQFDDTQITTLRDWVVATFAP